MREGYERSIKKLLRFDDKRGSILVLEEPSLPFIVKRVFITFHTEGERGNHAHMVAEQLLICLKGSLEAQVIGRNINFQLPLSAPDTALYVPPKTWLRLKNISKDSIILVLASERYESTDYISDFNEFMSIIRQRSDST